MGTPTQKGSIIFMACTSFTAFAYCLLVHTVINKHNEFTVSRLYWQITAEKCSTFPTRKKIQ